jgi:hypothetical protein
MRKSYEIRNSKPIMWKSYVRTLHELPKNRWEVIYATVTYQTQVWWQWDSFNYEVIGDNDPTNLLRLLDGIMIGECPAYAPRSHTLPSILERSRSCRVLSSWSQQNTRAEKFPAGQNTSLLKYGPEITWRPIFFLKTWLFCMRFGVGTRWVTILRHSGTWRRVV